MKTGWERDGCVHFNSSSTDHGRGHRHYRGRAEYFAVHVPVQRRIYIVPVDLAADRRTYLRLKPTANNQARRVRHAEEFALERYLDQLRPGPAPVRASDRAAVGTAGALTA